MAKCCGRPDNRNKKNSAQTYYEKYAYLSKDQMAKKLEMLGTDCTTCGALTFNNDQGNCSVCGNPKNTEPSAQ